MKHKLTHLRRAVERRNAAISRSCAHIRELSDKVREGGPMASFWAELRAEAEQRLGREQVEFSKRFGAMLDHELPELSGKPSNEN